jgi:hypothetical protein
MKVERIDPMRWYWHLKPERVGVNTLHHRTAKMFAGLLTLVRPV